MKKNQKLKVILSALSFILLFQFNLTAQNVGINTDNPDPSALLHLHSTDKGFLPPTMTTVQRNLIPTPAEGLIVYDEDDNHFWYFDGLEWIRLVSGTAWELTRNTGTNPTSNFLGTIDEQDFVIRTQNSERMRITKAGNVGIGTTVPHSKLHTHGSLFTTSFDNVSGSYMSGSMEIGFTSGPSRGLIRTMWDVDYEPLQIGSSSLQVKGGSSNANFSNTGQIALKRGGDFDAPFISFHKNDGTVMRGVQTLATGVFRIIYHTATGWTQHMSIDTDGNLNVSGDIDASGTKNFLIAHPLDPNMKLRHAALEGPEAAVFYRGESELKDGKATITLPNYFEALTKEEGRTIQLTAKGKKPFILSYEEIEKGNFKVYGTKDNGSFSWEVKAIRGDIGPLEVEFEAKEDTEFP